MRKLATLIILGVLLLPGHRAGAAASSDWPSLNADSAQSNSNPNETSLTTKNVLKLHVRWSVGIPDAPYSYPVVAAGRVYVPATVNGQFRARALDAARGKVLATYAYSAQGGLLYENGSLYLAGSTLVQVNPSTGVKLGEIKPSPRLSGGGFWYPVTDHKLVLAGYASTRQAGQGSLYGIQPNSSHVWWRLPSLSAEGTLSGGRIVTATNAGAVFYDEHTIRVLATQRGLSGAWFGGKNFVYGIGSVGSGKATLYAFKPSGKLAWKFGVGPQLAVTDWPHAVTSSRIYVASLRNPTSVVALDPSSGHTYWKRAIPDVVQIAATNSLVLALTYNLGQPVRVVAINAQTGQVIGAIVLSGNYYAFNTLNELMVADGRVFIRLVGPSGARLVALGL